MAGKAVEDAFTRALSGNAEWRAKVAQADPSFFANSAKTHAPKILWIGCADSRVPETTLTGMNPGEIFTHRNIANTLLPADLSSLAVIEFSVKHLKVEHAVVCGHTGCGGVISSLKNGTLGIMDPWLQTLRSLRMKHNEELSALQPGPQRERRLSELNVLNSLDVLSRNQTIIEAIKERNLKLHGLIYDVASGKLEVVDTARVESEKGSRHEAFDLSKA